MTVSAIGKPTPNPAGPMDPQQVYKRVARILAQVQSRPDPSAVAGAAAQLASEIGRLPPPGQRQVLGEVLTEVAKGTSEYGKRLAEENRRLKEPPRRMAALEGVGTDTNGKPLATVATREGFMEVQISTDLKFDELRPGQRVILAQNGSVIGGRTVAPANPLCEFETLLPDGRVLARLEGGQRLVLLRAWDLLDPESARGLKPGDVLEYEPLTQQVLRLARRSARIQEFIGEPPDVSRRDIGGCDAIWGEIEQQVIAPILYAELHAKYGLAAPRGMLFCGPPGCGKTLLIKAAARAVLSALGKDENSPVLFVIPGSSLLRPYVGEGSGLLRAVSKAAEEAAAEHGFAVILLDDFEYAGGLHRGLGDHSTPAYSTLTQALLAEMDGLGNRGSRVTWMATTNRPDLLDSAVMRPGRFGTRISVPRPGPEGCCQIAKVHLKGRPLAEGLSADLAADMLAERIFSASDHSLLLRVHFADAGQEEVFPPRVISGAILAAAVTDAARRAVAREAAAGPGGLRLDDLVACLDENLRAAVAHVTPVNIRHYYLDLPDDRRVVSVEHAQPSRPVLERAFVE